jgi:hypothetical protein
VRLPVVHLQGNMTTPSPERITGPEADIALAKVFAKQVAFKGSAMHKMAVTIVRAAIQKNGTGIWPDDEQIISVVQSLPKKDRNVVGSAWRWMRAAGIMERGEQRRRSTAGPSKGREIACWHVTNFSLARTFLVRMGTDSLQPQQQLKL